MKQRGLTLAVCFLFSAPGAWAQSDLDQLDHDLQQIQKQHEQTTLESAASIADQLAIAMASPQAAIDLYQKAGGTMPTPAPVKKQYQEETPSEKDARDAIDTARISNLAAAVQIHCGMMHFALLLITKPDEKGLHDALVTWFKAAAHVYPLIQDNIPDNRTVANGNGGGNNGGNGGNGGRRRQGGFGTAGAAGDNGVVGSFRQVPVSDSIIARYFGFNGWGDKEQAQWSVNDMAKIYESEILAPLRTAPTSATLAAWDDYIMLMKADEPDSNKWDALEYPPLAFERAYDDYEIKPSPEKLQVLVDIIKANPNYPKLDDMISRAHLLVQDYRATHAVDGVVTPTPMPVGTAPAPNSPNVTVTETQVGDMTVVTTHTNAPPIAPVPPVPPVQPVPPSP